MPGTLDIEQKRAFNHLMNTAQVTQTSISPKGVQMFTNISTSELISMNVTYLREYRANPTQGNLQAVKDSDAELSRRNA